MLNQVVRPVGDLKITKCALGVTMLVDDTLNGPLEDLDGRGKNGDWFAVIGIKEVLIFLVHRSYMSTLSIRREMGVEARTRRNRRCAMVCFKEVLCQKR